MAGTRVLATFRCNLLVGISDKTTGVIQKVPSRWV